MPIYRITMRFEGGGQGWTETHSLTSTAVTCRTVAAAWVDVAQKRANCLGTPFYMRGFRVAMIRDNLGAAVKRVATPVRTKFSSNYPVDADETPVGVLLQMKDLTESFSKNTIMGGIPLGVCWRGMEYNPNAGNFGTKVGTYAAALQNAQVGWQQFLKLGNQLAILGYAPDNNGRIVFTVPATPFVGPFPTQPEMIRVAGLNGGSTLNGELLVEKNSISTFRTHKAIAAFPYVSGGLATFYLQPLPFIKAAFIGDPACGQHKRGNRSFLSPGRARRRQRG